MESSWKVTKSVDTRKGGFVCPYIPTKTLMIEFNGRLTDSGQVVTDPLEFSRLGVEESALVLLSFSASNVGHDEEESHPEWTIFSCNHTSNKIAC